MSFEIFSENLIYQSTITASSENLLFPVSNIRDPRRSKVFRSLNSSDSIVLDFQETSEIDSFVITDSKMNGFGVSTITLQFNATNEWSSPMATETIEFSPQMGSGFAEFTLKECRFCRIVLTSSLPYCEISNFFIGKKLNLGRSVQYGWNIKDNEIVNKQTNRYGQLFTDLITRQKTINASINLLDKDQVDKIFSLIDFVGETKPFYVRIGCDNMVNDYRRFSGMVYLTDIPTITNQYFGRYNLSFAFIEAT